MRNYFTIIFALSFVIGAGLITTGLASLPDNNEESTSVMITGEQTKKIEPTQAVVDTGVSLKNLGPVEKSQVVKLPSGSNIAKVLTNVGFSDDLAQDATNKISEKFKLAKLKAGMPINIDLVEENGKKTLKNLKFKPSLTEVVELKYNDKNELESSYTDIPLKKVLIKSSGTIEGSLYQSAGKAGVPQTVIAQSITALSYDVDFQRDIQPGNKFTILFEGYADADGNFIKGTRPTYIKLKLKRKDVEIYSHETSGSYAYYYADGTAIKKALLRTPVDVVRITSGFGVRKHPILGFTKMHKGVDFGAAQGTPIYAAGDGIIEKLGYFGSYGNYVRIKHSEKYSTAYGHISRFNKGMRQGVKVRQGQVIAYVGATGRATGSHLHFEVLQNDVQINPVAAKLPLTNKLGGKDLAKFKAEKDSVVANLKKAPTRSELADANKKQTPKLTATASNPTTTATVPNATLPATAAPAAAVPAPVQKN